MSGAPKDHYVPQFYLDAFAIEGPGTKEPHIHLYSEENIIPARISDVASEKYFNTTKDETGKPDRSLDNFFTQIEDEATAPLRKIIAGKIPTLKDTGRKNLSLFFATLATRTPGHIKRASSMRAEAEKELFAQDMSDKNKFRKLCTDTGLKLTEDELEEQHKIVTSKKYQLEYKDSKGFFLATGLELAVKDLAEIFYNKIWHLVMSSDTTVFVTSDNPVSIYRPRWVPKFKNAGYGDGTIMIALTPKIALLMRDKPLDKNVFTVGANKIKEINKNTIMFSDKFVFSNLKSKRLHFLLKSVGNKKFQGVKVTRAKNTPYTFFSTNPVPDEPLVNFI